MKSSLLRVPLLCAGVLATLAAVSIVGRAQSSGTAGVAPVQSMNHLQIRVTDPKRSYEFYTKLLGGTVIDTSRNALTMKLGDTDTWLSLGGVRAGSNLKPGTLDHVGVGVDLPAKPDALRQALKEALPSANVRSPGKPGDSTYDRSIYLNDPDGISIQLISTNDAGRLPGADATPAVPRTRREGVVAFRSINHLAFRVTDRVKSQEFHSKLLGATLRDQNRSQITVTLPRTKSWLSLLAANEKAPIKAGNLDHLGIGIDWPPDVAGVDALREKLKAVFPDGNVRSPGQPTASMTANYNRSIYVSDPDGLSIQLISVADDGGLGGGGGN